MHFRNRGRMGNSNRCGCSCACDCGCGCCHVWTSCNVASALHSPRFTPFLSAPVTSCVLDPAGLHDNHIDFTEGTVWEDPSGLAKTSNSWRNRKTSQMSFSRCESKAFLTLLLYTLSIQLVCLWVCKTVDRAQAGSKINMAPETTDSPLESSTATLFWGSRHEYTKTGWQLRSFSSQESVVG